VCVVSEGQMMICNLWKARSVIVWNFKIKNEFLKELREKTAIAKPKQKKKTERKRK
jgi:hypothetical protein